MTDAEQVACDALRMAGLGEVADNLEFAREAVRNRVRILNRLEYGGHGCDECNTDDVHHRECKLIPLLETQPEFWPNQIELAHDMALRMTAPPMLRRDISTLEAYRRQYPHTYEGRTASALFGSSEVTTAWDAVRETLGDGFIPK